MFRKSPLTLGLFAALLHGAVMAQGSDAQRLLIEQGKFWQGEDKPTRAAEVWNRLLMLDASQPEALYGLGLIAVKDDDLKQARDYLARLQAIEPMPREALQLEQDIRLAEPANARLLEEARLAVDNDERAKADALYRRALGGKPAQGLVGREFYNNMGFLDAHWPESRAGFERLSRERPEDPYVALFFAKQLVRRDATRAEGIRALETLARREDIGGDAAETWRLALTWMGAPEKAQAPLFERYLKAYPNDDEIGALQAKGRSQAGGSKTTWTRAPALDRGLKALEKGDLAVAERELSSHLKSNPNDGDALGGLGVLRQRQERFDDAELLLSKAVQQKGGSAWRNALDDVRYWALLQRARDSLARERVADARQQLEQARRLKPQDIEALLALADLQAQQGDVALAEQGYRQALVQRPQEARALRGLAQVLAQQGKADEAMALINRMPAKEREAFGGLGQLRAAQALQRARIAEARGDTQAMRQALESALRDDPNNAWARFSLARLYVDLGAVAEARSLMDGLLATQPNDRDALYSNALLSIQLGEWEKAQQALARIPQNKRDADVNRLVAEVDFNLQLKRIADLSRSGQKAEARVFLSRLEESAEGKASRLSALASAYADAGDPQRAMAIMRGLLASSPREDLSLTLSYAGILLQAEQDVEVAAILRDLQARSMSVDERRQYDDLLFLYRVRQAEQLRERGQLAAAYETLAPALAQRPQDRLAVSALSRMYEANGESEKALELLKPLMQRHPQDASLQVAVAGLAARRNDKALAESSLENALKLAPQDAQILTSAAEVYRSLGRSGTAAELLRKVVAQEKRQQSPSFAAAAPTVGSNPFAGVGSGVTSDVGIPAPVQAISETADPLSSYAQIGSGLPPAPYSQSGTSVGNPFAVDVQGGTRDRLAGMSEAARSLDQITQERSPFVAQGLSVRSNDSESGLSKITEVQAPFEVNLPVGDNRLAVRVTPVNLNAGGVSNEAKVRFGSGLSFASTEYGNAVATAAIEFDNFLAENPDATDSELEEAVARANTRREEAGARADALLAGAVGRQSDAGVGLAVAWENEPSGVKADIGVSPMGFLYSTIIGGVGVERPLGDSEHARYSVELSRRAVTDSLVSFAGARDARTGVEWGGVTANGGRAQLSYDDGEIGVYGYGALHALTGNNVKANTRAELGSGIYWYLLNDDSRMLTAGLSLTGIGYENNQNNFTYGNGGYFSPQNFFSLAVPLSWAQRTERWTYALRGSVGIQHIKQDSAPYFPNDKDVQRNLEQVSATAAALGVDIPTRFDGSSSTGIGYSLYGAAEYRLGRNFSLGGELGINNAQDYRQWNGGMYLRYMFEDQYRPMSLPVSPHRSPYSN
ncbi:cellulose synthase subunit BcsC-related outer membrane protein [Ectopseudomonas oleovorans]|uniref:cellulose biosynthesis protein BcsC n=1 Tax=Ectopseudomonas oleovorans TaxID=301 RepID=UPI003F1C5822